MKKYFAMVASLLAIITIISPFSLYISAQNKVESVIDFSVLPVSEKLFYQKQCLLDTKSLLFTSGIMVDSADTVGEGTDKTNFRGFYTRDANNDGKTDTMCAVGHNANGMRFTFGVDSTSDWTGAGGIIIHIDNSRNTWSATQTLELSLNFTDGTVASLKSIGSAGEAVAYFISDDKVMSPISLNVSHAFIPGSASGWLVLPKSAFAIEGNFSAVSSIKFDFSSKALIYTAINNISVISDVEAFIIEKFGSMPKTISLGATSGGSASAQVNGVATNMAVKGSEVTVATVPKTDYDLTGIYVTTADGTEVEVSGNKFTMPDAEVNIDVLFENQSAIGFPSRFYTKLVDFSKLSTGDYRGMNWDCIVNTDSLAYTSGIVINKEEIGIGSEKTNFHGFWGVDTNGDGKTDYLKAHPYNDGGMRFTLGFNSGVAQGKNPEALILRIETTEMAGSSWNATTLQAMGLTLTDSAGKEYKLTANSEADKVKFISSEDFTEYGYSVSVDGKTAIPVTKMGWTVIPMDYFTGLTGDEVFVSASFDLSSTWNAYTNIKAIGMAYNHDEIMGFLSGKALRYNVNIETPQNGQLATNLSLTYESRTVTVNATANSGYFLKSIFVKEMTSGKETEVQSRVFTMPADDVTVRAVFEESPYNSAKKLAEIYTVTQDFSAATKASYVDWDNGPVLDDLINEGILVKDLDRGFKAAGVVNCYNGNGIYIDNDDDYGNYMRLWAHDNLGMHINIKSNQITDNDTYNGVVIHIHDTVSATNVPGFMVKLYLKGEDGQPDMQNPIEPKSIENLYGTVVYLVDDETGEVTERTLGYSQEQAASMNESEKYYSQFLLPDGYEGYLVIPFNYFRQEFSAQDVASVRLDYTLSNWEFYSNVYDFGFTKSVENFIRIASLGDYKEVFLKNEIYDVKKEVFERYYDSERSITLTVVKNYILEYSWIFDGVNIKNPMKLNPTVDVVTGSENDLGRFYLNPEEAVFVDIKQTELPGKVQMIFDVSWNFYKNTIVKLYKYDVDTGNAVDTGQTYTISGGLAKFNITEGGTYLIAMESFLNNNKTFQKLEEPEKQVETITENYTVEENTGHYETVPGKKVYKTITKISYGAFYTWFIVLIIVGATFVLAAGTFVTYMIIKKKKGGKDNEKR